MVVVPKNSPKLKNAIEKVSSTTDDEQYQGLNIMVITVANRIYWLNLTVDLPMYLHSTLTEYEISYENALENRLDAGIHLYQSMEKDWRELPSPIPEGSWVDNYVNKRIKENNERLRALFDKVYD